MEFDLADPPPIMEFSIPPIIKKQQGYAVEVEKRKGRMSI